MRGFYTRKNPDKSSRSPKEEGLTGGPWSVVAASSFRAAMEDAVRLRVEFDDHRVLTKTQRLEGLCRCWLLLRPELSTVSDVATHLVRAFALHLSCPHGVLLSVCVPLPSRVQF